MTDPFCFHEDLGEVYITTHAALRVASRIKKKKKKESKSEEDIGREYIKEKIGASKEKKRKNAVMQLIKNGGEDARYFIKKRSGKSDTYLVFVIVMPKEWEAMEGRLPALKTVYEKTEYEIRTMYKDK
jgi:hypothetical protein